MGIKKIVSSMLLLIILINILQPLSLAIENEQDNENLIFENEKFKQYLIGQGYDTNGDGEINKAEIAEISQLWDTQYIEYPEYFNNLENMTIIIDCSMENLKSKQLEWKNLIERIPNPNIKNNIQFIFRLDLGEINYSENNIVLDLNDDFSTTLEYYNGIYGDSSSAHEITSRGTANNGISYENLQIKIRQDIIGEHDYYFNQFVYDKEMNVKSIDFVVTWKTIDDGNIPNLNFKNKNFKQYLIDSGCDTNNDGEINKTEIYNINWLNDAPDIEYPEYFENLDNITFKLECSLDDANEKQAEIEEKARLIGNKNCTWKISTIKVYIGELRQSQNDYILDINEYFSKALEKYPYTFKDYYVYAHDEAGYSTNTNAISLQDNKIIINRNILGKFDMYVNYNYNMIDEYDNEHTLYYEFIWTTLADGDETKEVEFEDNKFKNYVLNNFDYNGDGKITEFEMAQITAMDMYNINEEFEDRKITSLKGIEYAKNLKFLNVIIYNDNSNISLISQLSNLETLKMYNGDLKDYLKELPNLKTLDLGYTKLNINNLNDNLTNFSYLGYNLTNVDSIKYNNNLTTFSFWNMNSSEHINYDFLCDMNNLRSIHISEENGSIDLEKLKDLENLNRISFRNMTLCNLEYFNEFKSNDISQIELSGCKISNIDFIKKFTKLNYIDLRNNNITDISTLNGIFKKTNTWNFVDLTGNSINTKEEKNAKTIEYFENNNIDYRIDEYDESEEVNFNDENLKNYLINSTYPKYDTNNDGKISKNEMKEITTLTINNNITDISGLEYATNLKDLDFNCYNTNTMDLTPLNNLQNIEKITFMCEFSNMNGFDFLKNSSSLKEICIYNYPHKFDFNGIEKFVNLEKIELHINNYDGEEAQLVNTQKLKQLSKLTKLDISTIGGTISTTDISNIPNLNFLGLRGKIDNLNKIFSMQNLNYLSLDNFTSDNQSYDLMGIENLVNLKTFKYVGGIDNITNFIEINKVEGLEKIILNIRNNSLGYSNTMTDLYKDYMLKEKNFVDYLQGIECNNIEIDSSMYAYVGEIQIGQEKTITYEEISPLMNALMTRGNKLYNDNVTISNENGSNNGFITIDSANKTITISASDEIGEQSAYIRVQNNYGTSYEGMYSNNISLLWKNVIPGDTSKKIEFEDENLKNILIEKYDIDNDKEITENDIINITNLNINNCNIHSLEGLQNAINLKSIDAANNKISDITPVINLEKLQEVIFDNNLLTDITCIKDAKWSDYIYDEVLGFCNNFINFEENNENYNALKKWMYKDIPENRVSLPFVENIKRQNYGNINDINNEVVLDINLKNKLLELGIDTNKDGIITRMELYHSNDIINQECEWKLDLSNSNIKNISGLEFINVGTIDLSNNEIDDITPITKNNNINNINLSNNKIENIAGIENSFNIYQLNLSNNKISNIEPITNLFRM